MDRHPSKTLEWLDDGSVIYRMTVPLNLEIVWWVASWKGVKVLEPDSLREQVREHALEIVRTNSSYGVTSQGYLDEEEAE